ncbi:MAG TPA: DUF1963 domain-containing protein [Urbifossiella sp.]|nr:DUF1963 domain-containing protein [Urbifossiella sp.]
MEPSEIVNALGPWRDRVRRSAWRPVVEPGDGLPTGSKFCGTPWTGPEASWPECASCKVPMGLLLQLRLDDLPAAEGRRGSGLLQFFHCSRGLLCKARDAFVPFADRATRVRVLTPIPSGEAAPAPPGYDPPQAPARRIVGWDQIDDLPGYHEREANGLIAEADLDADATRVRCPGIGLDVTIPYDPDLIDDISDAAKGDKLGGWPRWVQREEYPSCPRCGQRMALVFQVAAGGHAGEAFGDFRTGHITQCPEHPDVVAFGAAC